MRIELENDEWWDDGDFYVCPHHEGTGGYESCCNCGEWEEGDPNYGRHCSEENIAN